MTNEERAKDIADKVQNSTHEEIRLNALAHLDTIAEEARREEQAKAVLWLRKSTFFGFLLGDFITKEEALKQLQELKIEAVDSPPTQQGE